MSPYMKPRIASDDDKLQELFDKATDTDTGCTICHLAPNAKGYCYISFGRGDKKRVHRFVYEQLNGVLLNHEVVMHTCDVRNCIEPTHLEKGTVADNQRDMANKGRSKNQYGGHASG